MISIISFWIQNRLVNTLGNLDWMQHLQLKISLYVYIFALEQCLTAHVPNARTTPWLYWYPIGSYIKVTCNNGYMLDGSDTMTCQPGGKWTTKPVCNCIGTLFLLYLSICMYICSPHVLLWWCFAISELSLKFKWPWLVS